MTEMTGLAGMTKMMRMMGMRKLMTVRMEESRERP
jgi:hypothetical protein